MSGDPENEYFGDGLAEELLNALAGIEGLKVAARTSAFSFKGTTADVRTIGDTLNVATVLRAACVARRTATVMRAASLDEAKAIAAADPAVRAGLFTATVRMWTTAAAARPGA